MPTIQELQQQAARNVQAVDFEAFKLVVNAADGSGKQYQNEKRREEFYDPVMKSIIAFLRPQLFVDIGANYGFASLIHRHLNPEAVLVAVEMSPLLVPFIRKSFEMNGITEAKASIVHAACGEAPGSITTRLNVFGSADNRVTPATADKYLSSDEVTIPVISIDQLLWDVTPDMRVLFKFDTQGYEQRVFAGAVQALKRIKRWAIKTEFGPDWLSSQHTDAKSFLHDLVDQYDVAELPTRSRFKDDLNAVMHQRLRKDDVDAFVDWVARQAMNGRGWCDLLILPKSPA